MLENVDENRKDVKWGLLTVYVKDFMPVVIEGCIESCSRWFWLFSGDEMLPMKSVPEESHQQRNFYVHF
jgi:hypothetical protein